jgi:hypothetical protein
MKMQKCYIMNVDIGENKLRHISDTSCIDLPIQIENDVETEVKLNSTFKSARFGGIRRKINKVSTIKQVCLIFNF